MKEKFSSVTKCRSHTTSLFSLHLTLNFSRLTMRAFYICYKSLCSYHKSFIFFFIPLPFIQSLPDNGDRGEGTRDQIIFKAEKFNQKMFFKNVLLINLSVPAPSHDANIKNRAGTATVWRQCNNNREL